MKTAALVIASLAAALSHGCSSDTPDSAPTCRREGEHFGGKTLGPTTCCEGCEGLHRLKIPVIAATCEYAVDGTFVCTRCGDGVCGEGEGVCNCPADCTK